MRPNLLTILSLTCLLAACADHSGSFLAAGDSGNPTSGGAPTDGSDLGNGTGSTIVDGGGGLMPGEELPSQPDGTDGGDGDGGDGVGGGQPVPEPGTLLLVGSGLAGVALLRRRRRPTVERAPE